LVVGSLPGLISPLPLYLEGAIGSTGYIDLRHMVEAYALRTDECATHILRDWGLLLMLVAYHLSSLLLVVGTSFVPTLGASGKLHKRA
jgi:hypothetical protein